MDPGERTTGTPDEHYGLISVLYHALHGAENCGIYALDAEAVGNDELAAFFREAQGAHVGLAERAKELLGIEAATPSGTAGATLESEMPQTAPREEMPLTSEVPQTPSGGAPADAERGISPGSSPGRGDASTDEEPVGDVAPTRAVPPDAPRTEEPPPRTGESPPSPSEPPPTEEPPSEEHLPRQGP